MDLSFESSDPLVYRLDPFSDPVDLFFNPADPKSKHLDPHFNPGAEDIFPAYLASFLSFLRAAILDSTHEGRRALFKTHFNDILYSEFLTVQLVDSDIY